MPDLLIALSEAAVLALSLSVDAFTAGFAYGSKRIILPARSVWTINLICTAVMGLSLFLGALIKPYLPGRLDVVIAFGALFLIGLSRLLDSAVKSFIRKHAKLDKKINFSLFSVKFILNIYADPEEADADVSGVISPAEAAALALSLSLDGVTVGFGAALVNVNAFAAVCWSLFTNYAAVTLGHKLGVKAVNKLPFNISWFSGAALLALAVSKLF